jgi:hypothetical protein
MIQQFRAGTISSIALIDCLRILSSPGTNSLGLSTPATSRWSISGESWHSAHAKLRLSTTIRSQPPPHACKIVVPWSENQCYSWHVQGSEYQCDNHSNCDNLLSWVGSNCEHCMLGFAAIAKIHWSQTMAILLHHPTQLHQGWCSNGSSRTSKLKTVGKLQQTSAKALNTYLQQLQGWTNHPQRLQVVGKACIQSSSQLWDSKSIVSTPLHFIIMKRVSDLGICWICSHQRSTQKDNSIQPN